MKDLKERTKRFALRVIRMVDAWPEDRIAGVLGKQLLRCGTSVGANYRAASRARSNADFIAKLKIVEEECDEALYWMELIVESDRMAKKRVEALMDEANLTLAMTVASIKRSRRSQRTQNQRADVLRPS